MRRATKTPTENSQSEAKMLNEELRKLRTSSPWTGVLLFYLGAASAAVMLIAGVLIARWL
ncbi:hypothetical protein IAE39_000515 [Pseudomonas sp. S37]|uniref:hypothetical protein n=1 Tax=Pseudomonas sp. S37 TaxID=2767449 RepID=UPI001912BF2A|nr:hypothetical protein [Pseudomonas sp. S37]MBK4992341.1 hypothetical protein [Pseudomonas sp. S37]